ncbi:MAG: nitrilase family protein [Bacteroidales bacterium]|jgi:predicted amidohydrolase|nr:nitrilase family protein [Bacteroidales bacterium]
MNISLVQYDPKWEDAPHNFARLEELLRPLSGKTDLIVLPEMFPTGFSMNVERIAAHAADGRQWMLQQAKATGAMTAGTMATCVDRRCYNRFYWVAPDGNAGYYDKHHLFSMSEEAGRFSAGGERKRFSLMGWEIQPAVCYDLRFPAWCRNTRSRPYDLLVCAASWPAVRRDVWHTLLKARALENQCFVAGVNRTGTDGNGSAHHGGSTVYGPKGEIVGGVRDNEEGVATVCLSLQELHRFREKFPVLDDMDDVSF